MHSNWNFFFLAAEFLGFEDYIPSFASTVGGEDILKGVNYASVGSGIRAETGQHNVYISHCHCCLLT